MSALAAFFLVAVESLASSWPAAAHPLVPAIYIFGDSTADVGNNNYLPGAGKANFHPYGVDYPGSTPTGRFCNGYIGVDFIAQRLGFEKSPPAALSVRTAAMESRGVNYASGGSGVLDLTGQNVSLSLNTQIALFRKSFERLVRSRGKQEANIFLSGSLFVFSTFNNDLFAFFSDYPTAAFDPAFQDHFFSSLTTAFGQQIQMLYDLGARKVLVFGTGRLGCPPLLRRFSPAGDCLEVLNIISQRFNIAMKDKMRGLSSELEDLKYSYINLHSTVGAILDGPEQFDILKLNGGFTELKSACCGGGFLNAETMCNPNSSYCADRDAYVSWDSLHPTQASYRWMIDLAYGDISGIVEPISLEDLVRES